MFMKRGKKKNKKKGLNVVFHQDERFILPANTQRAAAYFFLCLFRRKNSQYKTRAIGTIKNIVIEEITRFLVNTGCFRKNSTLDDI